MSEYTADQLDRMADAYTAMAVGAYAGRAEQGYCEDHAESARGEAELLRKIVPIRPGGQAGVNVVDRLQADMHTPYPSSDDGARTRPMGTRRPT